MKKPAAVITAFAIILCSMMSAAVFAAKVGSDVQLSEVGDGVLRIEEAGTYILTGKMEGSVCVDPGEGEVTLILDGADINGGTDAAIIAVSGDALHVELAGGSVNRVIGAGPACEYGGAIYSRVNAFFEGSGTLYIASSGQSGIFAANAGLVFEDGNYTIGAAKYGLSVEGNNSITVNGGMINIEAANALAPSASVIINGGTINDLTSAPASTESQPSSDSTGNGQPALPEQSTDGTQPEVPVQPAEGTQPEAPIQPADSTQPEVPTQPANSTQPEAPIQPAEGTQPGVPDQSPGSIIGSAESASEVVAGTVTNSAADLEADLDNATYLEISDENSAITISASGTYSVSGTCSDGNITVKKGTAGVVLILENLDLTSTTGATVCVNKDAEVQIIISGTVILTDNENPEDENSEDEATADAYDGAALKVKSDSDVYVTGDGTLVINGNAKNGVKGGDDSSIVFDGVTVNITAANDAINTNYDVTLLSGNFTISAGDDAIHADHIVTIGKEDGAGPVVNVTGCNEGIEGTVVNIFGGDISIIAEDDAINAANSDGVYEDELDYSINVMGGKIAINCGGDGLDSNGSINLIDGSAEISSASNGGEAGIDYDGQFYISDDFSLNNSSGIAGPDEMPQNSQITPQGGMNQGGQDTPQGGMNQGGQDAPQGGMNQSGQDAPQDGMNQSGQDTPQDGMNQSGQDTPQGGMNQSGQDTPQGGMNQSGQDAPQDGMNQPAA